ncbi:MAG: protein phosphatase 2C domain-containing protein [Planctomycetota bacterium]
MNQSPAEEVCRVGGLTDVGRKRADNQDQFLIAELRKSMMVRATSLPVHSDSRLFGGARGQVLVVADGMGGHASGRRASSIAVDNLISQLLNRVHWFLQRDDDAEEEFVHSLQRLLRRAHAKVLSEAANDASNRGMGTTLTMAHIVWPHLYVVHAGDSRCYLIRDGVCRQLTTDHTLARQMVEAGGLKPEEEASSRWSNVLWNVLGGSGEQELLADVQRFELQPGDSLVLCSDGLSRYLSHQMIADVVVDGGHDVQAICHRLVAMANDAGGEDNITVVVSQPDPIDEPGDQALVQTEVPLNAILEDDDHTETKMERDSDLIHPLAYSENAAGDSPVMRRFAEEETLPEDL